MSCNSLLLTQLLKTLAFLAPRGSVVAAVVLPEVIHHTAAALTQAIRGLAHRHTPLEAHVHRRTPLEARVLLLHTLLEARVHLLTPLEAHVLLHTPLEDLVRSLDQHQHQLDIIEGGKFQNRGCFNNISIVTSIYR